MIPNQLASLPSLRPAPVIGYQSWSDLLFVHWRLPPERVAPLLPPGLELDLWDGDAWIGLVAFHMSGVRPWWFPCLPGVSAFHETNVRTYVVARDRPGVWFFSLEAANRLAVEVARRRWHLNYHHAAMALSRDGDRLHYRSRRRRPALPAVGMEAVARISEQTPSAASAGTLAYFLIERYTLFSRAADGSLWSGQVHHQPYAFAPAALERLEENLLAAAGLAAAAPPCHAVYSRGVSVAVSRLTPVA